MKTMAAVLLVMAVSASQPPAPSQPQGSKQQQQRPAPTRHEEKRGTEDAPVFVRTLKSDEEVKQEAESREENATSERWLIGANIALTILTAVLAFYTVRLWHSTHKMVEVAEDTAARQLRAYLVVQINSGSYQERPKNIKFEVRPQLLNTGQTPAHAVSYWAKAAILPNPLPADFDFPRGDHERSEFVLGSQQSIELNAFVDDYIPDPEVLPVALGTGERAVFIWGRVGYRDVFKRQHHTDFCHCIRWIPGQGGPWVRGHYEKRHHNAT